MSSTLLTNFLMHNALLLTISAKLKIPRIIETFTLYKHSVLIISLSETKILSLDNFLMLKLRDKLCLEVLVKYYVLFHVFI